MAYYAANWGASALPEYPECGAIRIHGCELRSEHSISNLLAHICIRRRAYKALAIALNINHAYARVSSKLEA